VGVSVQLRGKNIEFYVFRVKTNEVSCSFP
jgi:hypothetical protein